MACDCRETRISYTDPRGNGRVAPVRYRCATHPRPRAVRVKPTTRTTLALPAPGGK